MSDKRHFHRIKLDIPGTLAHQDRQIPVMVKDVSLQGIRLAASESELQHLPFDSHIPYRACFTLNEDSPLITLNIEQLYRQTDSRNDVVLLGCKLSHSDIDTIAALRRVIELNAEDESYDEKEINALVDALFDNA